MITLVPQPCQGGVFLARGIHPSINAAYEAKAQQLAVSRTALYDKINGALRFGFRPHPYCPPVHSMAIAFNALGVAASTLVGAILLGQAATLIKESNAL